MPLTSIIYGKVHSPIDDGYKERWLKMLVFLEKQLMAGEITEEELKAELNK